MSWANASVTPPRLQATYVDSLTREPLFLVGRSQVFPIVYPRCPPVEGTVENSG